ncbi:hypothetical protein BGX28_000049 [Mortierella sp. GBA30]|nr:hypothetical protein BGX28_000049 [Mortierella sp. GBA30]
MATSNSSAKASAAQKTRSSVRSSVESGSLQTLTTITSATTSTVSKPLLFINNVAAAVSRPKPAADIYVQSQSAFQQKMQSPAREEGKIKKSSNCFIKYRTHMHPFIVAKYGNQNNKEISRLAGRSWRNEPEHIKAIYRQQANEEKKRHECLYPSYAYNPARSSRSGSKNCSSNSEEMKVPNNPSKSSSSASATPSKIPASLMAESSQSPHSDKNAEHRHEPAVCNKLSGASRKSASTAGPLTSEQRRNSERPFVVTETPLHDFKGDAELTVRRSHVSKKRTGAQPLRRRNASALGGIDESGTKGTCLSATLSGMAAPEATSTDRTPLGAKVRANHDPLAGINIAPGLMTSGDGYSYEIPPYIGNMSLVPFDQPLTMNTATKESLIDHCPFTELFTHEVAWNTLDASQNFSVTPKYSGTLDALLDSPIGHPIENLGSTFALPQDPTVDSTLTTPLISTGSLQILPWHLDIASEPPAPWVCYYNHTPTTRPTLMTTTTPSHFPTQLTAPIPFQGFIPVGSSNESYEHLIFSTAPNSWAVSAATIAGSSLSTLTDSSASYCSTSQNVQPAYIPNDLVAAHGQIMEWTFPGGASPVTLTGLEITPAASSIRSEDGYSSSIIGTGYDPQTISQSLSLPIPHQHPSEAPYLHGIQLYTDEELRQSIEYHEKDRSSERITPIMLTTLQLRPQVRLRASMVTPP